MANVSAGKNSGFGVLLILIVFSSIFAAIFSGPTAIGVYQAKKWNEVPCQIISSKVEEKQGSGKRKSTTYRVNVTYQYEVDGKSYQGKRYDFFSGSSTGYRSKAEVVRSLPKGAKTVCFVNPKEPTEAVLNRKATWDIWFLAAPLIPIAMLIGALYVRRDIARSANIQTGEFRSSNWRAMLGASVFAVIFAGITTGFTILTSDKLFKEFDMLSAFAVIFGLASVALMVRAIHAILRYIKFGESTLKITTLPVLVGSVLEGMITPNKSERLYGAEKNFTLRLKSLHRFTSGSGKNQSQREEIVWEEAQEVQSSDGSLRFSFGIPANCRATSGQDGGDGYFWRLEVGSQRPGVDYAAQFVIPITEGEVPADQKLRASQGSAAESVPPAELEAPEHPQVRREEDRSGATVFIFPSMMSRLSLIGILVPTVFICFWLRGASHLFSGRDAFALGIGAIFVLVALSILGTAVSRLYKPIRVAVDLTGITVTTRRFGIPFSVRVPSDEIESIEVNGGSGPSNTGFDSIQIRRRNGKLIDAGYHIKDRREAEWVVAEMSRLAGVKSVTGDLVYD